MDTLCSFCAALEGSGGSTTERALFESESFVIWPSLGAIVAGWTLVVPKRHILALGVVSQCEQGELDQVVDKARAAVASRFGDSIIFEHGAAEAAHPVGCGVDHAHLHVVPFDKNVRSTLEGLLPLGTDTHRVGRLADASAALDAGLPYIYLQDFDRTQWLYIHPNLPSQGVRRAIAAMTGHANKFDWRVWPYMSNVQSTIEALSAAIA